jgi:CelD/BcsL family acetyltransferase involved in cellulose biosynthesis
MGERPLSVAVTEGREVLHELGPRLDSLHEATSVPVTARRTWLQSWVDSQPEVHPVAVCVEGPGGRLEAAALVATRGEAARGRATTSVVAMGHGPSDVVSMPARDHTSARELADGLVRWLAARRGTWELRLRQVQAGEPALAEMAQRLRRGAVVRGDVAPLMRPDTTAGLRGNVSRSHRQRTRLLRNRLAKRGYDPSVEHLSEPDAVAAVMPEVERVMRARDEDLGRRSQLDDPAGAAFFRLAVDRHARQGDVVLTTLRLQGELAAYVLCFVDGGVYRMWNCRFDPQWAQLSVGRVAMDAAVEHAIEAHCDAFDFMRGAETYKDSYATEYPWTEHLMAWSHWPRAARGRLVLAAREQARRLEQQDGRTARLVVRTRDQLGARGLL